MRKLAALLVGVGLTASSTLGAVVTFSPNPGGTDTVLTSALPTTVNFDLVLGLNGTPLSSADVIVGTDGPLNVNGFIYNPDFVTNALLPPPNPAPISVYPKDLYFGGAQTTARNLGDSYVLGSLAIGVPAGLAPGDYTFKVDGDFDGFSNLNGTQGLSGVGTVHVVVPEPATLGLLALGALGLIRRRLA